MEIFGDKDLTIPKDFVLLKVNARKHLTQKLGDLELDLASDYTKMDDAFIPDDDSLITYDGIIKAVPHAITKRAGIEIEVKVGDHVYFHHLCTDPENRRDYKGEECYYFNYVKDYVSYVTSNLYCKIVDGEIIMLGDWNLIEIEKVKQQEVSSSILLPQRSLVKKENFGTIKCVSPNLKNDLSPGDKVFVDPETIYTIYVEGEAYYAVSDRDVLAKVG